MTITKLRATKRNQIINFFVQQMNQDFSSPELHKMFGPSFRSRVSEINRDPHSPITIKNRMTLKAGYQESVYRGQWKDTRNPQAQAIEVMAA